MRGTISTSRWHPSASDTNTIPAGIDQRRMRLPPSRPPLDDSRARRNKAIVKVSMGRGIFGLLRFLLRKPLGLLGRLDEYLGVHLPAPVLTDQGVELVLGETERVHEAVLRLEDVRHQRLVALGLPRVDGEIEDLDICVPHHGPG